MLSPMPSYIFRPLRTLLDSWQFKLPFASVVSVVWTTLREVGSVYQHLLSMNPTLLTFNLTAIFIDTLSGMYAAYREEGAEALSSYQLRATGWKVIEYAMVTVVFVGLENATSSTFASPIFQYFGNGILIYIGVTETWSVKENLDRIGIEFSMIQAALQGDLQPISESVKETEEPYGNSSS